MTHSGTLIYPSSAAISALPTIDLPERKTTLPSLAADSIICMTRHTLEANVAITNLPLASLITFSRFCQTTFSEIANHGFWDQSESQMYNLTPSVPIRAIFARSAGRSIAGVWSILKSADVNITPLGVVTDIAKVSGILWLTRVNSTKKEPTLIISTSGSTILYFICWASFGSSNVFFSIHNVNGVV